MRKPNPILVDHLQVWGDHTERALSITGLTYPSSTSEWRMYYAPGRGEVGKAVPDYWPHNGARRVAEAVSRLTEREYFPIILHYVLKIKRSHSAELLNISVFCLDYRMEKAHKRLGDLLNIRPFD